MKANFMPRLRTRVAYVQMREDELQTQREHRKSKDPNVVKDLSQLMQQPYR